jgi:hypothetical protein
VASFQCASGSTDTLGVVTVACSATDNAGNTVSVNEFFTVADGFLGFQSPLPLSTFPRGGSTIPVKFTLGTVDELVTTATTRVTLGTTPGGAQLATQSCSWNARAAAYQCNLKTPKGIRADGTPYYLTVWQRIGTTWVVSPDAAGVVNPNSEIIYFR